MESVSESRVDFLASTLVTGGAERVVEALALALPKHGFGTRILCLYDRGEIGETIAAAGATVYANLARFRRDPFATARLASVMRKQPPAAVVSLDHRDAMLVGPIAARLAGIRRMVLMVHSTGLWGKRASFSRIDRIALRAFDRVVALAPSHAGYLIRREGVKENRIAVIQNGVDTVRFHPVESADARERLRSGLGLHSTDFIAVVVAALRPEKNHELILRAAARVRDRLPSARFIVVGEGVEGQRLKAMAEELSLGRSVQFLGRRTDVPEILAASDVLLLASHPVVETFPLVVLEGMAAGLAIVATDVGSVRDMLVSGEEGFIIPPGDEEALVSKLLILAEQPELRRRMAKRARDRVLKEFTIDLMLNGYANMLKSLIKNDAGGC